MRYKFVSVADYQHGGETDDMDQAIVDCSAHHDILDSVTGDYLTPQCQEEVDEAQERLDVDDIAQAFHDAYEQLAPGFSYKTRKASAVPWEDVPGPNKSLVRATVAKLINDGVIQRPVRRNDGSYMEIPS